MNDDKHVPSATAVSRAETLLDAAPVAGVDLAPMNAHRLRRDQMTADYGRACSGEPTATTASELEIEMATEIAILAASYKKLVAAVEA